jgi:hypothetical protein
MAGKFSLKMLDFHVAFRDLLFAVGPTALLPFLKEGVLRIFFSRPENSDGFGRV